MHLDLSATQGDGQVVVQLVEARLVVACAKDQKVVLALCLRASGPATVTRKAGETGLAAEVAQLA